MSTTVVWLLIYSSILTQQWILHNNQDWWSIITSERSSLIFCTTVKSNFLKTSRRPLLNRREWNLLGKTRQTLRALKCGKSNKQARLHVFTYSVCLCYMCLNVHCVCVTCVYTLCVLVLHMFTHTRALLLNRTPGDNWWREQNFWFEAARSLFPPPWHESFAAESLPEQWLLLPFVELVSLKTIEICNSTATSGLITSRQPARRMFFVILLNNNDRSWVWWKSIVLERKQICLML